MDLPLLPIPRDDWQQDFGETMLGSDYLQGKYDRDKSIREHVDYFGRYCPELLPTLEPRGIVVDVGPGFGVGLELVRQLGYDTIGVESPSGDGGMGDAYHNLSRLLHERQKLAVTHVGWQAWVEAHEIPEDSVFLFNSRGSWEQCYAEHLSGPPHEEHHECKRQEWRKSVFLLKKWHRAFAFMASRLVSGGFVLIHANGTGSEDSDRWYSMMMVAIGKDTGLELVLAEGNRLHKWKKP